MAAPPKPKKPPRRWRRTLAGGGGGLLVASLMAVAMLVLWLRSDDFQRRADKLIERAVEHATGEQLTLGSVAVELWPPAVEIEGFNLWDHETGETIVSVQRIRAPIVLRDGRPSIGQLHLIAPVVQLHLDKDGKLQEFDARPPGDPSGKPLSELPWDSLHVVDGTLRIENPRGSVEIAHFGVTPVDGPLSNVSGRLNLHIDDLTQSSSIAWPGVIIGPDRIEIPIFKLDTPLINLDGRVAVPLAGDLDVRLKGGMRLGELDPLFTPPTAVLGDVQLDVAVSGPPSDPKVEAAILGDDLGWDVPGRNWPLLQHRLGDLHAAITATRDGVDVEKAVFVWGSGKATVWGRVTPQLTVEDGHLLTEDVSLAYVLGQLDVFDGAWADVQLDAEAGLEGSLKPLDLHGPMDIALGDLRVDDRATTDPAANLMLAVPSGTLTGQWSITNDVLTIDAKELTTPRSRGSAYAEISTASGPIDIKADLPDADLSELRPLGDSKLFGKGHLSAHIRGEGGYFHAEGDADVRDFAVTGLPYADHLDCHATSPDLKVVTFSDCHGLKGETSYTGSIALSFPDPMSMDLRLHIPPEGRIEDVVAVFIDLPGMTGHMGGDLTLAGPLNDLTGVQDVALSDVDLWGERFPVGEAHGYMDQGVFTLDDLRVSRGGGTEGIVLRGGVDRAWALNMELVGDGLMVEHLDHLAGVEVPITGRLGFMARIDNTLFDPSPHGRIALTDVRYAGRPVQDSLIRFDTRDGVAKFGGTVVGPTIAVRGSLGLWKDQPYSLDADFNAFPAQVLYPVAADGGPVEAVLSGTLALHGQFGDHPSPVDLIADATDVKVAWGGQTLKNEAPWHYEQHGRSFELERFSLVGGTTRFSLSASGGDEPLDVAGSGVIDMDLLRMVVPGLERADGLATVDVTARGRPPDVKAEVDVRFDGDLVRHAEFPGAFEDVELHVRGGSDGYEIVPNEDGHPTAGLAGGTITASGHIAASGWRPTRYNLAAVASGAQVQWVNWLPPVIGDAELQFDGPPDALLLSGLVNIDEMTFSDRIDWEDWVVAWKDELLVDAAPIEEVPYFSFDVALKADNTIRLRNNVAEGSASADLRVIGDTARPGLVGTVDVGNSVAYLQDREFVVDRGEIAFRDPWTWDPDLDFDLVTDITSRERRYRVNYLVSGPFSNWRSESRSDPALPQADVNALLWFGMTAEELEEMGELPQAIGQGVADMLLADFLVSNQTAQELRGELPSIFDRVDLVTGVDARGEYSPDPRLLVEKKLDDFGGIDVTAEIDLVKTSDQFYRADIPLSNGWSLSAWYATRQRDRQLPIGGAYGVDLRARWDAN